MAPFFGQLGLALALGMGAVGSALADNPIAWLVPCHRVIRASGRFETHYKWGSARKRAMIGWEAAHSPAGADYSDGSPSTSNMV